jgi:hypothetical protein
MTRRILNFLGFPVDAGQNPREESTTYHRRIGVLTQTAKIPKKPAR